MKAVVEANIEQAQTAQAQPHAQAQTQLCTEFRANPGRPHTQTSAGAYIQAHTQLRPRTQSPAYISPLTHRCART
eukprot:4976629-Pleurochrysis_carterae.AAC.1